MLRLGLQHCPHTRPPSFSQSLLRALPKVMPSAVDMNHSAASPETGGRGRTGSISARAGQRPAPAETKAPAPRDPAWRQTFLGREEPRWQVTRGHHGGSNETGWRAGYSEIRGVEQVSFFKHTPLPAQRSAGGTRTSSRTYSPGCLRLLTHAGSQLCWAGRDKRPRPTRHVYTEQRERTVEAAYQLRAELLLHPLLITGVHSWVPQVPNGLGDEQVETVFHCKHKQRPVQRNTHQQEPKRSARSSFKVKCSYKDYTHTGYTRGNTVTVHILLKQQYPKAMVS